MYTYAVHSGATHTHTHEYIKHTHTHKRTDKVNRALKYIKHNKYMKYTHTVATHTHALVQSVEQACWVAVSTYSAAMATSSMAIDSAAKWVRVCERDNLV